MDAALWGYTVLLGATAVERLVELVVSRRNARWSFERGGREYGRGHFPFMVLLHTGLLVGCVAEAWVAERGFWPPLGVPMLAVVVLAQWMRWRIIGTLGHHWNTRVIVVPGMRPVRQGPYRFLRHPNYAVVVLEGVALPLVMGCWITAVVFTALNLPLLAVRIRCEERALARAQAAAPGERLVDEGV